jgi:hypothetical protein
LVLPAPEDDVEFAAMVVAAPLLDAEPSVEGSVEITVGPVTIRLAATTSAVRIAASADRGNRPCAGGNRMIFPSHRVRIMVATKPVDFRKGHDGLPIL